MNLLDLVIKIALQDDASKKIGGITNGITGKLSSAAKTAAKLVAAGVAAAVGGIVALTKQALDAYANYEQLVGGVETLYGNMAQTVIANADQAFQTAGMSANAYMEQVIGMSGSLIQSLDGDTAAAAAAANRAIVDMSDNANKMGTDIERIQDAYRGFARGNFTMLDNLALGYGGTRTEMQRLLDDAERIKASQGEMVEYSIDSYADMVEAIHVVQTEMGISGLTAQEAAEAVATGAMTQEEAFEAMGTTAKEATTTIQGSIGMMQAAWENWLTALGNEKADLSAMTDYLIQSIETVASNVVPRVAIIGERIMAALPDVIGKVAAAIPEVFGAFIGPILDDISSRFNAAFGTNIDLTASIGDMFARLQETMQGPLEAISLAFDKISAAVGPFVEQWGPMLAALFTDVIMPAFGYSIAIIGDFVALLLQIGTSAGEAVEAAITWFQQLPENVGNAINAVVEWFQSLPDRAYAALQDLHERAQAWGDSMGEKARTTGQNFVNGIVNFVQTLPSKVWSFLSNIISRVASWASNMASNASRAGSSFVSNVVSFVGSLPARIGSFLSNVISRVASWVSQMASKASSAARQFANNLINGIRNLPSRVASIGGDIVRGIARGITGAAGAVVSALGGVVSSAISAAKSKLGIASPSKVFRDEVGRWIPEGVAEGIYGSGDTIQDAFDSVMSLSSPPLSFGVASATGFAGGTYNTYNVYIDGDALNVNDKIASALGVLVEAVEQTHGMGRA